MRPIFYASPAPYSLAPVLRGTSHIACSLHTVWFVRPVYCRTLLLDYAVRYAFGGILILYRARALHLHETVVRLAMKGFGTVAVGEMPGNNAHIGC
eukprot:10536150-Lingulodinium_polyedra.AAC.1